MKTASAKKKSRRGGHNKREGVPRHPSGGINYGALERQEGIVSIARDARIRMYGVAANDAMTDKAGSVFGRMYLQGELGAVKHSSGVAEAMYEAGVEFAKRRHAYLHAIQSPRSPRSGSDIGYVHDALQGDAEPGMDAAPVVVLDDEAYAQRCTRAKARYAEVRRAAMEADPLALMALEMIVCEDRQSDRLFGPLRVGCNAIARMMRSERRG